MANYAKFLALTNSFYIVTKNLNTPGSQQNLLSIDYYSQTLPIQN